MVLTNAFLLWRKYGKDVATTKNLTIDTFIRNLTVQMIDVQKVGDKTRPRRVSTPSVALIALPQSPAAAGGGAHAASVSTALSGLHHVVVAEKDGDKQPKGRCAWCERLYGNRDRKGPVQCGHAECIRLAAQSCPPSKPWFCSPANGQRDCFNLHMIHGFPPRAKDRKDNITLKRQWEDIIEADTNSGRVSPTAAKRSNN